MKGSAMGMARKIIYQPVVLIHTVWDVETCHLLKKSGVADRVKGFAKVECNDNDVWNICAKNR